MEIISLKNTNSKEVIDLVLQIQQHEFNVPITIEDQPDLLEIENFYISTGGNFWGAFINGELVGTIALVKFDQSSAAIRKMFVKQEFRGKEHHIAQNLLDILIAYCNNNNLKNLFLGTVSVLKAAQRFYERNQFVKIEKEMLPSSFPAMSADDIFYTLAIPQKTVRLTKQQACMLNECVFEAP
jgi:N-acetylglutamate synthase-like GNAT family acetyltransferase